MRLLCCLIVFIMINLYYVGGQQTAVYAQSTLPEIYFCVDPEDPEKDPYLIEFFDSAVFGIMIPEDASVTLHTNSLYTSALYTINSNARSGGYLTMEHLATLDTVTQVPIDNPCLNEETVALFDTLPLQSIPLPISVNHAIVVQHGEANLLQNPFQRVISFTFGIGEESEVMRNLQIIQVSEIDPFLNFRFFDIVPNTPFMVIANKEFGIGQSLQDTSPPEFSRERPSDIRSFVKSDLEDLYDLNIFEVAQQSRADIYINSGLVDTYRGNYIRISLAPDTVERIPSLEANKLIRALPGAIASFIAIDQLEDGNVLQLNLPFQENPLGQLSGESIYRIIEINEITGQLIIDFDGNPAIVEGWLVEATSTD